MAKWKPTKAWAREAKKATKKLIADYKAGRHSIGNCPLCHISDKDCSPCSHCPWVVFEGARCYQTDLMGVPVPERLSRLDGWVEKENNVIEG